MKMTDLLEKDRENILTSITQAGTAAKAVTILENETDKLLLKFNDQCDSDREREAAAHMMQAVRLSVPMIDSAGKTKVWERGSDDSAKKEKGKVSIPFVLLTIASVLLVAYGLVPLVVASLINAGEQYRTQLIVRCCFVIGGMIMGFFAGAMQRKKEKQAAKEHQVEIRPDADKIFRNYRAAIYSVDQSLEEISAAERWSKREKAGEIDGRKATTPEIELFSDLMAASYSGDPEYALEKIEEIKYYLHRQQIEVVDYSEATAQYFDLMPGNKAETIRPALVADGQILKKGLASTGK